MKIQLEDIFITVQPTSPDSQQILIKATPQGETLARLLVGENPARENGSFVILHDPDVDDRLLNLVDALTAIRWSHPTYTQLVLDLQWGEAQ